MRTIFDASLNIDSMITKTKNVSSLINALNEAMKIFNKYGFCIVEIENPDDPEIILSSLKPFFGKTIFHERANGSGITKIANLKGHDGFLGASCSEHPLHTDGPFQKDIPMIMLLLCEIQSEIGGDSILVSSKLIYEFLDKEDPEGLELLKQNDIFTIKRLDKKKTRAIFDTTVLKDKLCFSFRYAPPVEIKVHHPHAEKTVEKIIKFINSPKNQIRFRMKPGQILIADNTAVMHGKTAFPADSNRTLYRLNLDGSPEDSKLELGFQ